MKTFADFRGMICTANTDGSIPLNAKVVCEYFSSDAKLLLELIAQANLAKDLYEAIAEQRKDTSVQTALQKYHGEIGTP